MAARQAFWIPAESSFPEMEWQTGFVLSAKVHRYEVRIHIARIIIRSNDGHEKSYCRRVSQQLTATGQGSGGSACSAGHFLDSMSENMLHNFMGQLTTEMKKDDLLKHLPEKEQLSVMNRMMIFTHGYASFICAGFYKNVSKQDIIKSMYEMGSDVIGHALYRHGKTEYLENKEK